MVEQLISCVGVCAIKVEPLRVNVRGKKKGGGLWLNFDGVYGGNELLLFSSC